MKGTTYLALLLFTLFAACSSWRGTTIEIQNRTEGEITEIELSGSGFSCSVPRIEVGGNSSISVHTKGETGIAVSFKANGKAYESPMQGYFEAGYKVRVIFEKDLRVTVESSI